MTAEIPQAGGADPWWMRLLRRVPFREVWLSVAVLFLVGEQFPFSNFPMYSALADESFYYVVTDSAGNILPYATVFRFRASHASKAYRSEVRKLQKSGLSPEDSARQAAGRMLGFLVDRAEPERRGALLGNGLVFAEVRVAVENGKLREEKTVLAVRPAP